MSSEAYILEGDDQPEGLSRLYRHPFRYRDGFRERIFYNDSDRAVPVSTSTS